jgi:hypothetical protein
MQPRIIHTSQFKQRIPSAGPKSLLSPINNVSFKNQSSDNLLQNGIDTPNANHQINYQ